MKKAAMLFVVSTLCVASLAHAGTLTVTKKDLGGSRVAIGYSASSADCIPAAFALQCTLTGGTVSSSSVLSYSAAFDLFPDYQFSNPQSPLGQGTPLARFNTPGALTGSAGVFSICMSAFVLHEVLEHSDADINYDGFVDIQDVYCMEENWLWGGGGGSFTDLNRDGLVNIRDVALLSEGLAALPLKEDALVVLQLPQGLNAANLNITADTFRGGAAAFNGDASYPVVFIPEPITVLLLGLGGLMLRKR